jgi:hypothetical protein
MRQILSRAIERSKWSAVPLSGDGSSCGTNYRLTPHWLRRGRAAARRTARDVIEFVGLVLLALVVGAAAAALTAVVLHAVTG